MVIAAAQRNRYSAATGPHILLFKTRFMLTNLIQQVHGLLHLLGFDHELSEVAEEEMEKEEEHILNTLEWRGKGLIKSAYDIASDMAHLQSSASISHRCTFQQFITLYERKMNINLFLITGLPMD